MAIASKRYCIKLTDQHMRTYDGTQWVLGRWNPRGVLTGNRGLCSGSFYHAYDTAAPEVALLLNPIHANFTAPRVFVAEWRGRREDDRGLKCGATEMRLVRELPLAMPSANRRTAFAILIAMRIAEMVPWRDAVRFAQWREWAEAWLAGDERTRGAAVYAAANAANAAAHAANAAANAAHAAANAAAYAANAAADAADAAAYAANAANAAAHAAAHAANAAADAAMRLMFAECAAWAIAFEDA